MVSKISPPKYIPIAKPVLGRVEEEYLLQALRSSWISSIGTFVDRFEQKFANYCGVKFATSCNSGTSALHLSLLALEVGRGDEVIVPNLTFVATANAVTYTEATPVFVDVDPTTWTLNPESVKQRITRKTRAIIPVHLYGYPADMDKIMSIAKTNRLFVIEDAAEAHGALYKKKHVGTIGDVGCFSLYGNKIITTGEGGMVITNHKYIFEKIMLLKNHGMSMSKRYYHPVIGFNYRMTNLQAAIGLAQLSQISSLIKKRQEIATFYTEQLQNTPGVILQPQKTSLIQPVCWLFSLLVTQRFGLSRDQLIAHLKRRGIDSRPFFYPLSSFPMYKGSKPLPVSRRLSRQGLNLPTFPGLTKKQLLYITDSMNGLAQAV